MSDRFDWFAAGKEEAAFELQRRHLSNPGARLKTTARNDVVFICVVCGKKPNKGDMYYRAYPTSDKNKVGHADCVDRLCAQQIAKTTPQPLKEQEKRGILHPPVETILAKYRTRFNLLVDEMYEELSQEIGKEISKAHTAAFRQIYSIVAEHVAEDKQSA